jgi:hypothetical protein
MTTAFQKFINKEIPKRISTEQDPTTLQPNKIPVSVGVGLQTEFRSPKEITINPTYAAVIDPGQTKTIFQLDLSYNQVFDCILKVTSNTLMAQKLFSIFNEEIGEMETSQYAIIGEIHKFDVNMYVSDENYCTLDITNNELQSINVRISVQLL